MIMKAEEIIRLRIEYLATTKTRDIYLSYVLNRLVELSVFESSGTRLSHNYGNLTLKTILLT